MSDLLTEYRALLDERELREAELRELKGRIRALEQTLLEFMEEQGLDRVSGAGVTISRETTVEPSVKDWDALYSWILDNEALFLLHRRLKATAWRELMEMEGEVPGVEPVMVTKLKARRN